jgi:hypothetical protein
MVKEIVEKFKKYFLNVALHGAGSNAKEIDNEGAWALYFYTGENNRGCEFWKIRQTSEKDERFFAEHPNEEVTIKQLRNKDFQMKLKKMAILSKLLEEEGEN